MDPFSVAVGVVAVFKDTYITVKFIKKTVQTMKGHADEQSELLTRYTIQIYRLRNLSRLFSDGNTVDMKLLETIPKLYLELLNDVLMRLQKILEKYAKLAANLDDDYRRFSPLSPDCKSDPENLQIDDDSTDIKSKDPTSNIDSNVSIHSFAKPKWWHFPVFRRGIVRSSQPSKKQLLWSNLPAGVQWAFQKSELFKTLHELEDWNKQLEELVAQLLSCFGFYEHNRNLQYRLHNDGNDDFPVNLFQRHVSLNKSTKENLLSISTKDDDDNLVSCEIAEAKASEPRVLVEFKQLITLPSQENELHIGHRDAARRKEELYGKQLARLLHIAGQNSFRTLQLNSYAWDAEKAQYMFLFNYPANASSHKPKSLNDLILSKDFQHDKLELGDRFYVAHTIASAVGIFHSDGWLHKSIRSHAIKFFFMKKEPKIFCDFKSPYLTDFEFSRPVGGVTRLIQQAFDPDYEVYRHPDRHGLPNTSYIKMHDIYSLGVVLLEIGLWQTARDTYDEVAEPGPNGKVSIDPYELKEIFLQDARERLPHRMGKAYQEAVIACLDGNWDHLTSESALGEEFLRQVVRKVDIKAFAG
ncbi:hypothetical protein GCG54_00006856 [Colletotrichum gloeosporioides]|uniref:Protein kinase domain-containing protein n=1 Tax=Colletotrichum gloeosporioides TaxID=474922 RepID=A0A8H4CQK0_COLGL|nr:uncharacterized protein GCG54_00006856 [Colletotrichum gloeosporioides]KAF3808238.1 hypothetical protein GCG54_00006856 [Colletotrichum gloeosporioides]